MAESIRKAHAAPFIPPAFFLVSSAIVVLFTLYQSYAFSTNALLGSDEARYILRSTTAFFRAESYAQYRDALFSHHANHLLLGMQLLSIGSYYLTGAINIKVINLFCTLLLVLSGLTVISARHYRWQDKVLLLSIVLPVVLTPSHNTCMLSAACTANHYFGLAMGVLSLFFFSLAGKFRYFVLAEILMVISMFSFASGMALFLLAVLPIFLNAGENRRFLLISHLVISVLVLCGYYFLVAPFDVPPAENVSLSGYLGILLMILLWFVGVSGYGFFWLVGLAPVVILLAGIALLLAFLFFLCRNWKTILAQQGFLVSVVLYALSTIFIIATGRYFSFQPTARYSVYAAFFLAFFLAMLVDDRLFRAKDRAGRLIWVVPFAALLNYVVALQIHYPEAVDLHQRGQICQQRWLKGEAPNQKGASCAQFMKVDAMQRILDEAAAEGLFDPAE